MNLLPFISVLVYVSITFRNVSAKSLSDVDSRVFFGEDSRPGEQKHLVLLDIQNDQNYMTRCSGSIIGEHWIVTAAHCICYPWISFKAKSYPYKEIGHGNTKYSHPNFKSCGTQFISNDDSTVDVGLLITKNRIIFDQYVQPIPMGRSGVKLEDVVTIAGYGQTEREYPNTPKQAQVTIKECNVREDLICTYGVTRPGQGDSGGPVTHNGQLVGVVSSGACYFNMCTSYYAKIEVLVEFMRCLQPYLLTTAPQRPEVDLGHDTTLLGSQTPLIETCAYNLRL